MLFEHFKRFQQGDSEAFVFIVNHEYIDNILGAEAVKWSMEKDELISELYIVLASRKDRISFNSDAALVAYIQLTVRGLLHNLYSSEQRRRDLEHRTSHEAGLYTEEEPDFFDFTNVHSFVRDRVEGHTYREIARRHGISKTEAYRVTQKELVKIKEEII